MALLTPLIFLVFAVFVAADSEETSTYVTTTASISTTDETDSPCNCNDHCPEKPPVDTEKRRSGHKERKRGLYEEDSDGDGELSICARNRDEVDRTFPSVCHMLCYNKCTRFRTRKIADYDEIITYVSAYRENFYKLHDGACRVDSSEEASSQS